MDILARRTGARIAPAVPTVQAVLTAPPPPEASTVQAVLTAPAAPAASTVQTVITAPVAPVTSTVQAVLTVPVATKQLSPDRPEVLMQAYLAEKTAWLAQHPTVRLTEYRKARKWKNPRPKVLKEQSFYMPKERRDLNGLGVSVLEPQINGTLGYFIVLGNYTIFSGKSPDPIIRR
ncbi:hypothetical protein NA56DRAFT_710421 [Hyaloscypha hepaticicola]|uniref:Uncharacterized protein n=1 Tax=Hyaloscypha hepaticicola TaxID=2082293 RepID=A0A2J6PLS8_9HELO|nr:hypothetical protein NA56DRAFT_710421 [Hyaloscypha hepaticicola]